MIKLIDNMDLIEPDVPEFHEDISSSNSLILSFDDDIAEDILQKEYNRRHPKRIYWITKDGSKINIKDMTDDHLLNVIQLIRRKKKEYEDYLEAVGGFPD